LNLLTLALASYSDLIEDDLGTEGIILWIYFNVVTETKEELPEQYRGIANDLYEYDPKEQLRTCLLFIERMNQRGTLQSK
jgi:hypothetical protein